MDSILTTTKKLAGMDEGYEHFDPDIIMYINSVFLVLQQLGVGPEDGFFIDSEEDTWTDFLPDNRFLRKTVKAYMGSKVRMQFDPPSSSALLSALEKTIAEFEWRLNVAAETISSSTPIVPDTTGFAVLGSAIIGRMKLGYAGG